MIIDAHVHLYPPDVAAGPAPAATTAVTGASLGWLSCKFLSEEFLNTMRHQSFHRTTEAGNLFYYTGAQIRMLRASHQKDGLNGAVQPSIHERHL